MRNKNLPEYIAPPPPPPKCMTLKERRASYKKVEKKRVYAEKPDTSSPTVNFFIEEGSKSMSFYLWKAFLINIFWIGLAIVMLFIT